MEDGEMRTPHTRRHLAEKFAATCAMIWVSAARCWAQQQTPPLHSASEFDVASVKQLDKSLQPGEYDLSFVGTSGKPFKISGNRVTVNGTVRSLIAYAYDLKDYQISGTAGWTGTLLYSINAKAPGDAEPTQEEVRPMLQTLLADRFLLKFHRDTKELPVYHLIQAKKTSKFKPAGPDETFSWNLTPQPGGTLRSTATKESIGDFVQLTGVSADRPLIDKTGLTGYIDYDIQISQPEGRGQDDLNRAILDAIKDQLGMKLEPAKDPIEMLVIDRIEKPSED
jgi:uncharacterized protein (TIGR03435 family)